jgi:hypothetical protein
MSKKQPVISVNRVVDTKKNNQKYVTEGRGGEKAQRVADRKMATLELGQKMLTETFYARVLDKHYTIFCIICTYSTISLV